MTNGYQWNGRHDGNGDEHLRMYQIINKSKQAEFALIGFSSDEGVRRNKGRVGAAEAPDLIRSQLANLPVHTPISITDLGTIICIDGNLEQAQSDLAKQVDSALNQGMTPIVLGGGHEVAFGSFSGLFQHLQKTDSTQKIGIINFDVHLDLREENQATSGTPFLQAAQMSQRLNKEFNYLCIGVAKHSNTKKLFNTAQALNCQFIFDDEIERQNLEPLLLKIDTFINQVDVLYITVDLDAFSASIAPGVSAPAVKGVELRVFDLLINHIQSSGKIRLLDIAECNPNFDQDQRTAKLAAYIVYNFIFNKA